MAAPPAPAGSDCVEPPPWGGAAFVALMVAAGVVCTIVLTPKHQREGFAGALVMTLVDLSMLALGLWRALLTAGPGSRRRLLSAGVAVLASAWAFAAGLTAIFPGATLAHADLHATGDRTGITTSPGAQNVTLRVQGAIAGGATEKIYFAVAVAGSRIDGQLSSVKREVRVGRGRARLTDPDARFFRRFRLPPGARELELTSLAGPLDGTLVVDLFPDRIPHALVLALSALTLILAGLSEAALGLRVYAAAVGVSVAAPAFVATWTMPGAKIEMVAGPMLAGALAGIFGGMTSAHASRRLLTWRNRRKRRRTRMKRDK